MKEILANGIIVYLVLYWFKGSSMSIKAAVNSVNESGFIWTLLATLIVVVNALIASFILGCVYTVITNLF